MHGREHGYSSKHLFLPLFAGSLLNMIARAKQPNVHGAVFVLQFGGWHLVLNWA
jgi:hypothetical protein